MDSFIASLEKSKDLEKLSDLLRVLIYNSMLKLYDTCKILITNTTGKIKDFNRSCATPAYIMYIDHGLIVCGYQLDFDDLSVKSLTHFLF